MSESGAAQIVRRVAPKEDGSAQTVRRVAPKEGGSAQPVRRVAPKEEQSAPLVRDAAPKESDFVNFLKSHLKEFFNKEVCRYAIAYRFISTRNTSQYGEYCTYLCGY